MGEFIESLILVSTFAYLIFVGYITIKTYRYLNSDKGYQKIKEIFHLN